MAVERESGAAGFRDPALQGLYNGFGRHCSSSVPLRKNEVAPLLWLLQRRRETRSRTSAPAFDQGRDAMVAATAAPGTPHVWDLGLSPSQMQVARRFLCAVGCLPKAVGREVHDGRLPEPINAHNKRGLGVDGPRFAHVCTKERGGLDDLQLLSIGSFSLTFRPPTASRRTLRG